MGTAATGNRFRRRLWWGVALVVLVLLGAGFWFYTVYFVSTDAAIRHAEAFLFRRMKVAQLAEQVRSAYRVGAPSRTRLLLNQDDPSRIGRMLAYYRYLSAARAEQIDTVTAELAELREIEVALVAENRRLETLGKRREATLAELEQAIVDTTQDWVDRLRDRLIEEHGAPDFCKIDVEGFEAEGSRFLLGIEWHPELMDDAPNRRLFTALVEASRSERIHG